MENFTITQLKTIVRHFNLKIKLGGRKAELLSRIDEILHFDGYEFHLKGSNQEMYLFPEILKKEKNVTKKPSKISHKLEPEQLLYPMPKKVKIKKKIIPYLPDYIEHQSKHVKINKKDYIPPLQEALQEDLLKKTRKELNAEKAEKLSQEIAKYGMSKQDYLYKQRNTVGTKAYEKMQEHKKESKKNSDLFHKNNPNFFI
jgi:hypothetical protein